MRPAPNFDRVARLYRWAEYLALGSLLQRTRTHFLPHVTHCRRAHVLGDGDGRFLAALLRQNPGLHATACDTSAGMLALLRKRCRDAAARLETRQHNALTLAPHPATDLIVSHFFLDCFAQTDVDALALQLAAHAQPGALWLVSDFAIPRNALRPLAAAYIRALYLSFRILTGLRVTHLPNPQSALTAAGFQRTARAERLAGLLYTELWQLPDTMRLDAMIEPHTERPAEHLAADAQPDPEPAAPSLAEPDPGVFHHDPVPAPAQSTSTE